MIAIVNTWSDLSCCHGHFRERAEAVRRGILAAGGFPVEVPVMTLAEPFQKPSAMMFRNLLAIETEEVLRSYPVDGAVLMGGCDKTTPALLMAAISLDLPSVFMPAGPMLRGNWRGQVLGSGTDVWRAWADRQAGVLSECAWRELEDGIARSHGHCMTMGTASTMTAAVDALGMTLTGASSIPAVDAESQPHGGRVRPPRRGARLARPRSEQPARHALVRERGHHGARARRLHELRDPPDRARPPSRGAARPRQLRPRSHGPPR